MANILPPEIKRFVQPPGRSCSSCCAFDEGECMNLVSFSDTLDGPRRPPENDDWCIDHKTAEEDQAVSQGIQADVDALFP